MLHLNHEQFEEKEQKIFSFGTKAASHLNYFNLDFKSMENGQNGQRLLHALEVVEMSIKQEQGIAH